MPAKAIFLTLILTFRRNNFEEQNISLCAHWFTTAAYNKLHLGTRTRAYTYLQGYLSIGPRAFGSNHALVRWLLRTPNGVYLDDA